MMRTDGQGTSSQDASRLFDGTRLTLARQLFGIRKKQLAEMVGKSPAAVTAWESGSNRPAASNVAALALALGVEAGFFATGAPQLRTADGNAYFRSLRSTTQMQRDQADSYATVALEVVWGLERHVEFPVVDVPSHSVADDDPTGPEEAARSVRHEWGLGDGPIRHMVREVERHGVAVAFSSPRTASLDAFSVRGSQRPLIVLNPIKHDYYRQRFDVAHELGHLVMHDDADVGSRQVEAEANRFAAELLTPADSIRDALPGSINSAAWVALAGLKEEWRVSIQALLMRARVLGTLPEVSYRNAMMAVSSRGWRRAEPGQITVLEQPSMLPSAVEKLLESGVDERLLAGQGHVPIELFRTITSRVPDRLEDGDQGAAADRHQITPLLRPADGHSTGAGVGDGPTEGADAEGGERA